MRPPQPSRVPAMVDALIAALGVVPNAIVIDGPLLVTPPTDGIAVGVGPSESVLVEMERQQGYGDGYVEHVSIICTVWSTSTGQAVKPRRDRCAVLLQAVVDIIRDDPKLAGTCDRASVGRTISWAQQSNETGAIVSVGFSIDAETSI